MGLWTLGFWHGFAASNAVYMRTDENQHFNSINTSFSIDEFRKDGLCHEKVLNRLLCLPVNDQCLFAEVDAFCIFHANLVAVEATGKGFAMRAFYVS